ncbi:MAG: hypothetical protein INR71_06905 [Terriglobus roseus]|nr:hypothetical protein [Terriglobus roseus]
MAAVRILTSVKQGYTSQRPYTQAYQPNGASSTAPSGPTPGAIPLLPNQGRVIQQGGTRVLCIADVRGTSSLHLLGLKAAGLTAR